MKKPILKIYFCTIEFQSATVDGGHNSITCQSWSPKSSIERGAKYLLRKFFLSFSAQKTDTFKIKPLKVI